MYKAWLTSTQLVRTCMEFYNLFKKIKFILIVKSETLYLFLLIFGIAYRFRKITNFCFIELKGRPDLRFAVASV